MADVEEEVSEYYSALKAESKSHSRQSSLTGSDKSQGNNAESAFSDTSSNSSGLTLILRDGGELTGESRSENTASGTFNAGFTGMRNGDSSGTPNVPPRMPTGTGNGTARAKVSKAVSPIPEEDITIPSDGNLSSFSADTMANFFKCLRIEDRIIQHVHRHGLDGKKFGRLKDSDLDSLGIKNPVLLYFRDKTAGSVNKKSKPRVPFLL